MKSRNIFIFLVWLILCLVFPAFFIASIFVIVFAWIYIGGLDAAIDEISKKL